ncbi:MAG: hypothetical protein ACI9UV_001768 [Algoriphagus sp.]|jgi:hypothetical protein
MGKLRRDLKSKSFKNSSEQDPKDANSFHNPIPI